MTIFIAMARNILKSFIIPLKSNYHRMSKKNIQLLATYGTLRDDDNSGAPWTKDFIRNVNYAQTGKVNGYQLLGHPTIRYPFAIYTGNPLDSIVVRLLSWSTQEEFDRKIIEADYIEGDDYERKIVEVEISSDQSRQLAYIYISKSPHLDDQWKPIRNGNWLERDVQ